jgi:hypothetical protein
MPNRPILFKSYIIRNLLGFPIKLPAILKTELTVSLLSMTAFVKKLTFFVKRLTIFVTVRRLAL